MDGREERPFSRKEDVHGWSQHRAALLRAGRDDDVDIENGAEEIESVGRAQVSSLRSCHRLIAAHLSEGLFQPERFNRSWRGSIVRARYGAAAFLEQSPSLAPRRAEIFAQAPGLASAETGRPVRAFTAEAPLTPERRPAMTTSPARA